MYNSALETSKGSGNFTETDSLSYETDGHKAIIFTTKLELLPSESYYDLKVFLVVKQQCSISEHRVIPSEVAPLLYSLG